MTINSNLALQIHEAQVEAFKKENVKDENLHGMDKEFKTRLDGTFCIRSRSWLPRLRDLREMTMYESHKSNYSIHFGSDKTHHNLKQLYQWANMETSIATYASKCLTCLKMRDGYQRHPLRHDLGNRDHQKDYANVRQKPLEFQVGDKVMLKVSPWKGVMHFGKWGKLNPRYIGPFKILPKEGTIAYRLELPEQLSRVQSTFRVSNLKKCLSDKTQVIMLDEIQIDGTLYFIEEPVEIMEREVKRLKQSCIPIVKVRWNSRRGHEFTWEREDQFQKKYPYPFAKSIIALNVTS
ncbi:putative reverse transcriptase domain-containing protein [Tanacetum coccineum]|uniref:Reverse transcriptase domain-containing protein n=1 Tax=Tanacetum coccineum TaxID=301880 RepID=A0ABQ5G9P0_9ASTR